MERIGGAVDRRPVHLDDILTLAEERLLHVLLDQGDRLLFGKDFADLEERRLHHRVDPGSETDALSNFECVDVEEPKLFFDDLLLHLAGQMVEDLIGRNLTVQEEHATLAKRSEHVVAADIRRIVTGDEIGVVDQPRHLKRALAEAKVADRDAAALLGVVGEVRLSVQIGVVADDLDGVLVRSDGAVRTEPPEHAGYDILRNDVDLLLDLDGAVGDVILDANGEVSERRTGEVIEDCLRVGRGEVLAGKTVAAADDLDSGSVHLVEGGDDVQIKRLAETARLFGPVKNGNAFYGSGKRLNEVLGAEGAIEADLQHTGLAAALVDVVARPFHRVGTASHDDNHIRRIGSADVVEDDRFGR